MLQTSSCVGMDVVLARESCAMEQTIVEMAVMRGHIKTAVRPLSSVVNINGGTVVCNVLLKGICEKEGWAVILRSEDRGKMPW